MGARPQSFKATGGGRLNGVDGTITGYRWTDEFFGEAFEEGNYPGTQQEKFHWMYFEISVRVDGADEDITDCLKAGDFDAFDISKDGLTATANAEGVALRQNTQFHKLLTSLVENGFPVDRIPDSETEYNYEVIVGTRVRFGQQTETDASGKPKTRVAKKGPSKGKTFDKTSTVVVQVYDLPGKGGKAKTADAKPGKKGKSAPDEDESVEALATAFLVKIVAANKGKMAKGKVSMQLLKPENGLFKHPEREAIRKLLNSDKFLNTEDGWSYNEEKEIITVKAKADDDEDEDDE